MDSISQWFANNMDIVFFIYGLAFFVMGISILIQPKKESEFRIANIFWLLSGFGLVHGVNEWLDMWAIIKGRSEFLDLIRWFCLVISFIFLFEFGRRLFIINVSSESTDWKLKQSILKYTDWWQSLVLGLFVFIIGITSHDFWEVGSIWARYLFGFWGAILTGFGFFIYYWLEKQKLEMLKVKKYFLMAALSFIAYGFFSGLVVPEGDFFPANYINVKTFLSVMHIPVQVFRTIMAIIVAFSIGSVMQIFNWEARGKLINALENEKESKRILLKTNELFEKIFSSMHLMIAYMDRDFNFIRVNKAYAEADERTPDFFVGKNHFDLYPNEENEAIFRSVVETSEPYFAFEKPFQYHEHPERGVTYWDWSLQPIKDASGKVEGLILALLDVTDRKHAEDESAMLKMQLAQSQKMEAIGRLAGGIAHDFNNLLTAIIGYGSFLKTNMDKENPLIAYVEQILSSAEKAANLTQQLLTFSRKQIINPKPVNLNEIVKKIEGLLIRLIGEDIELKTKLADEELTVIADSGQIEQVLMNLATNARDAMRHGGTLIIETRLVELTKEYKKTHDVEAPGVYAMVSVSDTGAGMDEKTKERIFEPFFTTKEMGRGTGLGLAIVYGIIKQHNGYINVYSEPGKGTTFRIYIPIAKPELKESEPIALPVPTGGTETVLIAEDDAEVRKITREVLNNFGYKVIEAVNGVDAINKFRENKDKVQLLLFDVIMPLKTGMEAYEEIRKIKPGIKVLFTSGYPLDVIREKGILETGVSFISKPVLPDDLLRKVREVLDK
ncbi:PAS domain-containing sensor histidine kinase [Dissulfurispira thermophila]|nr:PAS domain-containing sensor histidine kinase [Dissulfurispira thermophila]